MNINFNNIPKPQYIERPLPVEQKPLMPPLPPRRTLKFGHETTPLDSEIIMMFLKLDGHLFRKLLMLSPYWHYSILQAIEEYSNPFENGFIAKNHSYLFYKKSFTSSKGISFCGEKGTKIDRVLQCELMSGANNTVRFGYSYKVFGSEQKFRAEFRVDAVKENKARTAWVHWD